jgi:transketolase
MEYLQQANRVDVKYNGFVYMRTLRPKTKMLYNAEETFKVGGSKILKQSDNDELTVSCYRYNGI